VHVDIVYCSLPDKYFENVMQEGLGSRESLQNLLEQASAISRQGAAALQGCIDSRVQMEDIGAQPLVFASAISSVLEFLRRRGLRGNCFQMVRSFQITKLAIAFCRSHTASGRQWSSDTLYRGLLEHFARISNDAWTHAVTGLKWVPKQFLERTIRAFKNEGKQDTFPPNGMRGLRIGSERHNFESGKRLRSRLPALFRELLRDGMHVVTCSESSTGPIEFAVPRGGLNFVRSIFKPLYNDGVSIVVFQNTRYAFGKQLKKGRDVDVPAVIKKFQESRETILHFPLWLTAHQRSIVHEECELLGLQHESLGEGKYRHVRICK